MCCPRLILFVALDGDNFRGLCSRSHTDAAVSAGVQIDSTIWKLHIDEIAIPASIINLLVGEVRQRVHGQT